MTHKLIEVMRSVDKSHRGLGKLAVAALLSVKASKFMLVIAPSGCGKSTVTNAIADRYADRCLRQDVLTRSGLKKLVNVLSNSNLVVIVDDFAKLATQHARIMTALTLAELCYSHFFKVDMKTESFSIANFYGSAIANIQPSIFYQLVLDASWEAALQDKTFRYYHLIRPQRPKTEAITLNIDEGLSINEVSLPNRESKAYKTCLKIANEIWSKARAIEHLDDLLRASAAFDGRSKINLMDYKIVYTILRQSKLERHLIVKERFESARYFDPDLYALLVEIASYKEPTLDQVCQDYKMTYEKLQVVLNDLREYVTIHNSPKRLKPTKKTLQILKESGYL